MDVNILTKHLILCSHPVVLFLLLSCLSIMISCGGEPVEGEIVIRAEDITNGDSISSTDTVVTADTAIVYLPDSIDVADSVYLAVPDSIASDSIPVDVPEECPWERIAFEINGSIYASLAGLYDEPDILGAHIVRCMWWDSDPWNGMNAGDSLYLLIGDTGRENLVAALKYVPREGTSNTPFSVYSFRMTGDNYPSHYYADGTEVMKLLDYMPITTFEEMTAPYGEPRAGHNHSGVDYKSPEGTPVRTCRGGTVTRMNWNPEYNGNCIEIAVGSGYTEIFLHLKGIAEGIRVGSVLEKGVTVGYVGNTGVTSTAPHIHYQINDERGNSIDPYLFYSSHRRHLSEEDMVEFSSFRDNCEAWFMDVPGE
jgi:hypothetical protein